MADSPPPPTLPQTKNKSPPRLQITNNGFNNSLMSELKRSLFSPKLSTPTFRTRKSIGMAFVFMFILLACTTLFVFNNPSADKNSPVWLKNILKSRSQFSTFFSHRLFSNSTSQNPLISTQYSRKTNGFSKNLNNSFAQINASRTNEGSPNKTLKPADVKNGTMETPLSHSTKRGSGKKENFSSKNELLQNGGNNGGHAARNESKKEEHWWEKMSHCNIFEGLWVEDDSYPLYEPGSCPHIDEPFNCLLNGRPDSKYQNFRWQPTYCNIPKWNGKQMLELLRGKRLVFVGDSLNRNMWESMVCLLRNSVEDKSKVYEVSGKYEFRSEGAYSFVFQDYNCSVEFIRSPFLVQEWEMQERNGSKKETLRLDLVEKSYDKYRDADVLVFNTGHWWTHEKTSAGEGYYQEGSHVYDKLDVVEAFRKALTTWARWIEAKIDPKKTHIFFRGYSVSHFSGGEWYSGGKCHTDFEPVKDEKDLSPDLYPPITDMLENVLKGMKAPVFYLNITRITDFRKDAHPSVYRKPNMTQEERQTLLRHQDCSHWCLPGVPDTWNELLYAQLLMKHHQQQQQRQQQQKR